MGENIKDRFEKKKKIMAAARKEIPCDLVLANAKVANLYTMEFENADVAVIDGVIAGVGRGYKGERVFDCEGKILVPGFIEGHVHIESSYMVPRAYAAAAVPLGTTTVMADPHEIANTCGTEGVRFMKRESENLPMDIFYGAPSCVPASYYETCLEPFSADRIRTLLEEGTCNHLGEMMNYVGAALGDDEVLSKIAAASDLGLTVTGHAPSISNEWLSAYIISGATSDHECATVEEAMEKLRRGMYVMIREGSAARDLAALAPIVRDNPGLCTRCMAVRDDIFAPYMKEVGDMDGLVRALVQNGVGELEALRMCSLTAAEYFRLDDRGAIAPGKIADLLLLDGSVTDCKVAKVWKHGSLVAENGKILVNLLPTIVSALPGTGKKASVPTAEELSVPAEQGKKINVIGAAPHSIVTERFLLTPRIENGFVVADAEREIAKIAVVEKNRGTGRTAVGFIKNFGLAKGAVASSVAHDAHNFVCVGMDDVSMATALAAIAESGGGVAMALDEDVLFLVELPVGGLMSTLSFDELAARFAPIRQSKADEFITNRAAVDTLYFLSLSVIPKLKITDKGYFDISAEGPVQLFG